MILYMGSYGDRGVLGMKLQMQRERSELEKSQKGCIRMSKVFCIFKFVDITAFDSANV